MERIDSHSLSDKEWVRRDGGMESMKGAERQARRSKGKKGMREGREYGNGSG